MKPILTYVVFVTLALCALERVATAACYRRGYMPIAMHHNARQGYCTSNCQGAEYKYDEYEQKIDAQMGFAIATSNVRGQVWSGYLSVLPEFDFCEDEVITWELFTLHKENAFAVTDSIGQVHSVFSPPQTFLQSQVFAYVFDTDSLAAPSWPLSVHSAVSTFWDSKLGQLPRVKNGWPSDYSIKMVMGGESASTFNETVLNVADWATSVIFHELGHVAENAVYLSNNLINDLDVDYSYGGDTTDSHSWMSDEWESTAYGEALANWMQAWAMWDSSASHPRISNDVGSSNGPSSLSVEQNPTNTCLPHYRRREAFGTLFLWDLFDQQNDNGADFYQYSAVDVFDNVLASFPPGIDDHQLHEPFADSAHTIIDDLDGRSIYDYAYWLPGDQSVLLEENCLTPPRPWDDLRPEPAAGNWPFMGN